MENGDHFPRQALQQGLVAVDALHGGHAVGVCERQVRGAVCGALRGSAHHQRTLGHLWGPQQQPGETYMGWQ